MSRILLIWCLFVILTSSCVKHSNSNIIPVAPGLVAEFSYKSGSYWVYIDSVSGDVDSAYVQENTTSYGYMGCVLSADAPKVENITMTIVVSNNNTQDSERWYLGLRDSSCSIRFMNSRDSTESRISFTLFKYPINLGSVYSVAGCVPTPDNGSITDIIPEQSINNQTYQDAARSLHNNDTAAHGINPQYNDCFYVNSRAGLIEVVFNHPQDAVHRLLKLQRYHIVH